MSCLVVGIYYRRKVLEWCKENKILVLGLLSFTLFVSTVVLSSQKAHLQRELNKKNECDSKSSLDGGDGGGGVRTGTEDDGDADKDDGVRAGVKYDGRVDNDDGGSAFTDNSDGDGRRSRGDHGVDLSPEPDEENEKEEYDSDEDDEEGGLGDGSDDDGDQPLLLNHTFTNLKS